MKLVPWGLTLSGLVIEGCWLRLATLDNWARQLPEALLMFLLSSVFYLVAVWIASRDYRPPAACLSVIIGFTLLIRLTAWQATPALSLDLLRYRWEGRVQLHGGNPYRATPLDDKWAFLRDETSARIPAPNVPAGYGPLWELVEFGMAAAVADLPVERQIRWFRLPAVLGDMAAGAALALALRAYGLPLSGLVVYLWCPLPVNEFWVHGHNDSWVVALLGLALWAARKARLGWASAALSAAALVKLWPALLLPGLGPWRPPRRAVTLLVPLGLLAAPFLVWYATDFTLNARFLTGFFGGWRNNDSLFGLVLAVAGDAAAAQHASLILLLLLAGVVAFRPRAFEDKLLVFVCGLLLISANVHPWYLAWLLPVAVLRPAAWMLLALCLAPMLYRSVIEYQWLSHWDGVRPERWWFYVPVIGMGIGELLACRLRK